MDEYLEDYNLTAIVQAYKGIMQSEDDAQGMEQDSRPFRGKENELEKCSKYFQKDKKTTLTKLSQASGVIKKYQKHCDSLEEELKRLKQQVNVPVMVSYPKTKVDETV